MSGVNVRNLEKIQDKWLLFQRFVTSIVDLFCNVFTVIILMIACFRIENSLLGLPKCKYYSELSTQLMY